MPSREAVEGWIAALTPEELDTERGKGLVAAWEQYLDATGKREEALARGTELEAMMGSVADVRAQLLDQMLTMMEPVSVDLPTTLTLAEAEVLLGQREAMVTQARAERSHAARKLESTIQRGNDLPRLISEAKARRLGMNGTPAPSPPGPAEERLEAARQLARLALLEQLDAQIEAWALELRIAANLTQQSRAHLDIAGLAERRAQAELAVVQTRLAQLSVEAAARASADAQTRAADAAPGVGQLALANAELTARRSGPQGVAALIAQYSAEQRRAADDLEALQERYASVRQRIELVADSRTLAPVLTHELDRLPNIRRLQENASQWEKEIPRWQFKTFELQDARDELLINFEAEVAKAAAMDGTASAEERAAARAEIRQLMQERVQLLEDLATDNERLMAVYTDLVRIERARIQVIEDFHTLINRHTQWIRGDPVWSSTFWRQIAEGGLWFISGENWRGLGETLSKSKFSHRLWFLLEITFFALLWMMRGLLGRWLVLSAADRAQRKMNIVPMVTSLGLTLLIAFPFPALFWLVGNRLLQVSAENPFAMALGRGFLETLPALAFLSWLRALLAKAGYAETFMNWPAESTRLLKGRVSRLILLLAVTTIPMNTVGHWSVIDWANAWFSLGVGALFLAFSWTLFVTCNPRGRFLKPWMPEGTEPRSFLVVQWLSMALPLTVAALVLAGFVHGGGPVGRSMFRTFALILTFWVLESALFHAIFVHVTQLAALRRRLTREPANGQAAVEDGDSELMELGAIARHSRTFTRSVLVAVAIAATWRLWHATIPAFQSLGEIALWSTDNPIATADGAVLYDMVTVSEAATAMLVLVLSIMLARSLPGAIELTVLRLYKMDAGMRYAFRTVCSYVLLLAGPMVAFSMIGVGWSKLQWLAAALSVGLGFGLQEIFANFISGIIILFERPIRIGDIVTVGDTSGTVTRIQIRATVITDWDRRELIIPNKEIITGRITNWTLSDSTTRLQVDVGVAYGTDTGKALEIMVNVARETEHIIAKPPPTAVFVNFGDSSLNLRLYAFLESRDFYWGAMTRIHQEVDRRFKEAGISIPFPQRDIHMHTTSAGLRDG